MRAAQRRADSVHDGVSIGGSIEAEQRCATFGVSGRIGTNPLAWCGVPCTCLVREAPNYAQSHPFKRVKSQSALGVLLSQGCVLFGRAPLLGSFTLDCIISPETHHQYKNGPSLEDRRPRGIAHSDKELLPPFDRMI
jgi:hypothetical protein